MLKILTPFAAIAMLAACEAPQVAATPGAAPAVAALPFSGNWDCEGGVFTFTNETYQPGANATPLRMSKVEDFGNGNYGLSFPDGYAVGLMDVTSTSLIWSSPETGDVFDCYKLR